MRENLHILTEFCRRLLRLGLPLLKLWGTDTINGEVLCRCRAGKDCSPGRAGKHLQYLLEQSVIRTEKDLLDWIADGGNVGISLGFKKPGAPTTPLRFCVFDDDDGKARAWLAERGITSPWIVKGNRGHHIFCLLEDGVPDLDTRINPFKGDPIKLDIKCTGLMVLPMENGKRLFVDGQEVTADNIHLLERFKSLESLREWLPKVDPRTVIPRMIERNPVVKVHGKAVQENTQPDHKGYSASTRTKKKPSQKDGSLDLSQVQPQPETYHPNYAGIPYYERCRLAKEHSKNVLPSIPGKDPWGRLVKVVNDCILQYGLSDLSTWEVVRDCFNPRCRYEDGRRYPWSMADVVKTIQWAHGEGTYSTMAKLDKLADPQKVLARLKKKGEDANARRSSRREERRYQLLEVLCNAMQNLGYTSVSKDGGGVRSLPSLHSGKVKFSQLCDELETNLLLRGEPVPPSKIVGEWLRSLGLETYKGQIRKVIEQNAPLHKAG